MNMLRSCVAWGTCYFLFSILFPLVQPLQAQPITDGQGHVGIGTTTPDPSAILELESTMAGFLIPRMTSAERDAIVAPAEGLMIYNTDLGTFEVWSNASGIWSWDAVSTTGTSFAWRIDGNAGTDPLLNFLGTTDSTDLLLRVNGDQALRLIPIDNPAGDPAPNLVAGTDLNVIDAGAYGSVITGGFDNTIRAGSYYSVISGGDGNRIEAGHHAFIGGGTHDTVNGDVVFIGGGTRNYASGPGSVIVGGYQNRVTRNDDGIVAGSLNSIYSLRSFIGAGEQNLIDSNAHWSGIVSGWDNHALAFRSFIGGGENNLTDTNASWGVIGGGRYNVARGTRSFVGGGDGDSANGAQSSVVGGRGNVTSQTRTFIGGGDSNRVTGDHGSVVGGTRNHLSGPGGFIGGGLENHASSFDGVVVGGFRDSTLGFRTFIGGGQTNRIGLSTNFSAIVGGQENAIADTVFHGFIGGGMRDSLGINTHGSTIGGGRFNRIRTFSYAATIAGGQSNIIDSGSQYGAIGGGLGNRIDSTSGNATIAGGFANFIQRNAGSSFIGGGNENQVRRSSAFGIIVGGWTNTIDSNSTLSFIGGGRDNVIEPGSSYSVINGGIGNRIGRNSGSSVIAGGRALRLNGPRNFGFNGTFGPIDEVILNDSNVAIFANTDLWLANTRSAPSQLRFYESNGTTGNFPPANVNYSSFQAAAQTADIEYVLPATVPATTPANDHALVITAITGTSVQLGWKDNTTFVSDRNRKENFLTLSGEDVLKAFPSLELGSWNYRGESGRHYGVMAQDFSNAFGSDPIGQVGNDTTLSAIDLHGIEFLAIQGLEERTRKTDQEVEAIYQLVDELRRENEELRRQMELLMERERTDAGELQIRNENQSSSK